MRERVTAASARQPLGNGENDHGASELLTLGVNAQNFYVTPDAVWWSAQIPLSFGSNLIVITLSDNRTQTSTNITVTRN